MFSEEYKNVLKSPRWKKLRETVIRDRGGRCEYCGDKPSVLHLHHLTYEHLGNEMPEHVKLSCKDCHDEADKRRKTRKLIRESENFYILQRWACEKYGPVWEEVVDEDQMLRSFFEWVSK